MKTSHVVVAVVTAGVFAIGVLVGARAFGSDNEQPEGVAPVTEVTPTPAIDPPPAEPMLGPDETTALKNRVARLENRIETLEGQLAGANEKMKPLLDLYETFDGGVIPHGVMPGEDVIVEDPFGPSGSATAGAMASGIGLDAARRKAFVDEATRFVEQLEALEKANAEVTVDGDTTTIRIGTYAADGDRLAREWDDWVASNLTPDEQTAYTKEGGKSQLFGHRLGAFDRTVTIRDKDGTVTVRERASSDTADGEENVMETEISGPSMARELVLEGFNHLLK